MRKRKKQMQPKGVRQIGRSRAVDSPQDDYVVDLQFQGVSVGLPI